MLPTAAATTLPPGMAGTPASKADKSLRALFCGAANHLTQLYMSSLKLEKGATKKGYCRAVEDLIKFLQLQQQYGRTISIESLVEHLRTKKREILAREDNDFGDDDEEQPEEGGGEESATFGVGAPASTRSLASQFEGLSAGGGVNAFACSSSSSASSSASTQQHASRLAAAHISPSPVLGEGSAAAAAGGVHFGFTSPTASSSAMACQPHVVSTSASSSTVAASSTADASGGAAHFPSSTFRNAVSVVPFPLSATPSANNPFAPLDSRGVASNSSASNSNGRKRQYFEFFFDAPPNLTASAGVLPPASQPGDRTSSAGGFHFAPVSSHSTSTSISPVTAGSSFGGGGAAAFSSGSESDGAMDFSCYEHQAWKRFRREDDVQLPLPATTTSTNT